MPVKCIDKYPYDVKRYGNDEKSLVVISLTLNKLKNNENVIMRTSTYTIKRKRIMIQLLIDLRCRRLSIYSSLNQNHK